MRCDNKLVRDQLLQMLNGNNEALDDLYSYTGELIYAYILSITGDVHISEDIKQDTYLRILENIDKFNPDKNALAWIIQIAKNITINNLNRQDKTLTLFSKSEADINNAQETFPAASIENTSFLENMMNTLQENTREIVTLHIWGGYSLKEISVLLKLPLTTIHWRYRTAVKKLRKYYTQEIGDN